MTEVHHNYLVPGFRLPYRKLMVPEAGVRAIFG